MNFDDHESVEVTLPFEAREAARLFHEAAERAKAGRFDKAVASAMAIEATKFQFWFAFQNEALVRACAQCADTGQIEQALQISEKVAPKYKSASLRWIALACHNFGHVDRAFEVARAITDDYVRGMTLRALEVDLEGGT
jgi:hypothetical protein